MQFDIPIFKCFDLNDFYNIGHSFGSEHDPLDGECSPSDTKGGKYLMFPAALSGLNINNKVINQL